MSFDRIKFLLSKIVRFFETPFSRHCRFFSVVFLLSSMPILLYTVINLITEGCEVREVKDAFAMVTRAVAHAYLLTIVYEILQRINQRLGRIYAYTICIVSAIFAIVDIICYNALHTPFSDSFPSMILGSNPSEASDFFSLYFTNSVLIGIIVSIMIMVSVVFVADRMLSKKADYIRKCRMLCWFLLAFCMIWCYKTTRPYYMGGFFASRGGFFEKLTIIPEFFKPDPVLEPADCELMAVSDRKPKNIVMIIGESFSRCRSSLYGYRMPTNRLLEKYVSDSSLTVYSDVISPDVVTVEAFKEIMGTYHKGSKEEYYSCRMIPDVMSKAGYKTAWFSNKSRNGFYRNPVRQYAELCDSVDFVGNKFATGYDSVDGISYDENLLDPVISYVPTNCEYNFEVINMIGSHPIFSNRYPEGWSRFSPKNYDSEPESRRVLSYQYDTSIAYNDSIVNCIIDHFKDKESIVIYFPDHGLDVFQSSPDFIGHAIHGNEVSRHSAEKIPFMIYTSKKFQENFPDLTQRIRKNKDRSFNTTDIIYTLMDVAGVKFADNEDVALRSILR